MSKKGVWLPKGFDIKAASDIQAVAEGRADEHQQKRALQFIVERFCGAYDDTFDMDSERASTYNQGRRWVGLAIIQVVKLNLAVVKKQLESKTSKENKE